MPKKAFKLQIATFSKVAPAAVQVEAEEFGWDDNFFVHGEASLNMLVTVPRKWNRCRYF